MEKEIKYILSVLDVEVFYEGPEIVYEQLCDPSPQFKELNPGYPELIKRQFTELLKSREISTGEYYDITGVDFDDEDSLYDYLGKVYEYLFEGKYRDAPPHPPLR